MIGLNLSPQSFINLFVYRDLGYDKNGNLEFGTQSYESRNPNIEIRNPKQETQNPKLGTRNPKLLTYFMNGGHQET